VVAVVNEQHERVEELLAVRALGGLEPGELAEYDRIREEHGFDCEVCLRAELEFDEVAGRLAFALGPVAIPEGMEDAVVARAIAEGPAADTTESPEPADEVTGRRVPRGARRAGRLARTLTAVAAAIVLLAGGFAGGLLVRGGGASPREQALAQFLAHPDTRLVRFDAADGGNLAVAYRPGQDESFVVGTDLGPVPSGKQYELWMFPPGGGPPAPGPTFDPPSGDAAVIVVVPADVSRSMLMAVTVERAGGVGQPTTDPVFTAPIQTA
jgi:anti-sigma-K factor RskA